MATQKELSRQPEPKSLKRDSFDVAYRLHAREMLSNIIFAPSLAYMILPITLLVADFSEFVNNGNNTLENGRFEYLTKHFILAVIIAFYSIRHSQSDFTREKKVVDYQENGDDRNQSQISPIYHLNHNIFRGKNMVFEDGVTISSGDQLLSFRLPNLKIIEGATPEQIQQFNEMRAKLMEVAMRTIQSKVKLYPGQTVAIELPDDIEDPLEHVGRPLMGSSMPVGRVVSAAQLFDRKIGPELPDRRMWILTTEEFQSLEFDTYEIYRRAIYSLGDAELIQYMKMAETIEDDAQKALLAKRMQTLLWKDMAQSMSYLDDRGDALEPVDDPANNGGRRTKRIRGTTLLRNIPNDGYVMTHFADNGAIADINIESLLRINGLSPESAELLKWMLQNPKKKIQTAYKDTLPDGDNRIDRNTKILVGKLLSELMQLPESKVRRTLLIFCMRMLLEQVDVQELFQKHEMSEDHITAALHLSQKNAELRPWTKSALPRFKRRKTRKEIIREIFDIPSKAKFLFWNALMYLLIFHSDDALAYMDQYTRQLVRQSGYSTMINNAADQTIATRWIRDVLSPDFPGALSMETQWDIEKFNGADNWGYYIERTSTEFDNVAGVWKLEDDLSGKALQLPAGATMETKDMKEPYLTISKKDAIVIPTKSATQIDIPIRQGMELKSIFLAPVLKEAKDTQTLTYTSHDDGWISFSYVSEEGNTISVRYVALQRVDGTVTLHIKNESLLFARLQMSYNLVEAKHEWALIAPDGGVDQVDSELLDVDSQAVIERGLSLSGELEVSVEEGIARAVAEEKLYSLLPEDPDLVGPTRRLEDKTNAIIDSRVASCGVANTASVALASTVNDFVGVATGYVNMPGNPASEASSDMVLSANEAHAFGLSGDGTVFDATPGEMEPDSYRFRRQRGGRDYLVEERITPEPTSSPTEENDVQDDSDVRATGEANQTAGIPDAAEDGLPTNTPPAAEPSYTPYPTAVPTDIPTDIPTEVPTDIPPTEVSANDDMSEDPSEGVVDEDSARDEPQPTPTAETLVENAPEDFDPQNEPSRWKLLVLALSGGAAAIYLSKLLRNSGEQKARIMPTLSEQEKLAKMKLLTDFSTEELVRLAMLLPWTSFGDKSNAYSDRTSTYTRWDRDRLMGYIVDNTRHDVLTTYLTQAAAATN